MRIWQRRNKRMNRMDTTFHCRPCWISLVSAHHNRCKTSLHNLTHWQTSAQNCPRIASSRKSAYVRSLQQLVSWPFDNVRTFEPHPDNLSCNQMNKRGAAHSQHILCAQTDWKWKLSTRMSNIDVQHWPWSRSRCKVYCKIPSSSTGKMVLPWRSLNYNHCSCACSWTHAAWVFRPIETLSRAWFCIGLRSEWNVFDL